MPKKRFQPEEIIGKLRRADVLLGQGKNRGIREGSRGYRGDLRPVAAGARRDDDRPGKTPQGARARKWPAPGASRRPHSGHFIVGCKPPVVPVENSSLNG